MSLKLNSDLAEYISGKKVLLLNSLGKDSIAALEWLSLTTAKTISLNLKFIVPHPKDEAYTQYLIKKYPEIEFVEEPSPLDLNKFAGLMYQDPIEMLNEFHNWEYKEFSSKLFIQEMKRKYDCEFVCLGHSKYESVTRATNFYKNGLLQGDRIYPLGLLDKKQVLSIAKRVKLHPCYKTAPHTYDYPSWFKMRNAFVVYPEYYKEMLKYFPMLELDEYRYKVLLLGK